MNSQKSSESVERSNSTLSGWLMLPLNIAFLLGSLALVFYMVIAKGNHFGLPAWFLITAAILGTIGSTIMMTGFFTLQPNEARVLVLFGEYKGTVRMSGFHWANPFYSKERGLRVSLRARTLTVEKLKVNDKRGNPIEIAAVVVWRVNETAQATFDVDNYASYVHTQSETALRHLATAYNYDDGEENEPTLRSNVDAVSGALREELGRRLAKAGVVVDEARLTNLSYAAEIAQAMLRRQQAEAVIAARTKIVHGAVTMVDLALKDLAARQVVQLDDERKAAMVSNLMVVLCGDAEVHPVINTGTLYN
ncbi:MAG TPA: SPFH domain-containing protein [Verrucomicrobiae bacterium]|jgi:regulator of protease activity HflC (stomatin/prohibitin superfamily)